jgi:hypothetical protein
VTKGLNVAEKPIQLTAPQVRAVLDGVMTQTWRLIDKMPEQIRATLKHPPKHEGPYFDAYCGEAKTVENPRGMSAIWNWWTADDRPDPLTEIKCPYGQPGDVLWVRETFRVVDQHTVPRRIEYSATTLTALETPSGAGAPPWKLSIYLPRAESRIALRIRTIHVKRLHAITDVDARETGVDMFSTRFPALGRDQTLTTGECVSDAEHRATFAVAWDEKYATRPECSWLKNPWAWVIGFEVLNASR